MIDSILKQDIGKRLISPENQSKLNIFLETQIHNTVNVEITL